ncbi:hypothetical protein ACQ4PT_007146 [Festuca glaucescens]
MIEDTTDHVLRFEVPHMVERDRFSWFRDEEFARQTLAGLNPICIRLLTEFPIVSKLDPEVYGPPESALTKELLEMMMNGRMTVEEALEKKRLFMLDYHDVFLPYVHKVRELPDRTLYGSRTIFFLGKEGTLMPLAIELTRPQSPTKPQWKRALRTGPTPPSRGCGSWPRRTCSPTTPATTSSSATGCARTPASSRTLSPPTGSSAGCTRCIVSCIRTSATPWRSTRWPGRASSTPMASSRRPSGQVGTPSSSAPLPMTQPGSSTRRHCRRTSSAGDLPCARTTVSLNSPSRTTRMATTGC